MLSIVSVKSQLNSVPVNLEQLHHTEDMELVSNGCSDLIACFRDIALSIQEHC